MTDHGTEVRVVTSAMQGITVVNIAMLQRDRKGREKMVVGMMASNSQIQLNYDNIGHDPHKIRYSFLHFSISRFKLQ